MKNTILAITYFIILIFAGLFLTAALPGNPTGPGTPADSTVSQLTAATTASGTDIYYIVSGGASMKITHATLMSIIRDSIKARNYPTAGDWSFDGATFDANSAGKVTFNDSALFNSGVYLNGATNKSKNIFPFTSDNYYIGSSTYRYAVGVFETAYADRFIITNPSSPETDTVIISYDGTIIQMGGLNVADGYISMDSSATMDLLAYTPHSYTIPAAADTILTLNSANRYSMIELDLPGNMTTGVSRIYVQGAQKGMVLRLYNMDASYAAKFIDYNGNDDNMYLSADFDFGQYDYLELMCVVASIVGQMWIETGRANN